LKNIIGFLVLTLPFCLSCLTIKPIQAASQVKVQNGLFTIDGEPFYIVGVGYEPGTRPGSVPWNRKFEPEILRRDFEKIRQAHFNTIRTWTPLKDEELQIVEEYDLKVLMGIWLDPNGPFDSPSYIQKTKSLIRSEILRLKKWDCIIGYLIMNEPPAEAILKNKQAFRKLLFDVQEDIRQLGEKRPVSISATSINDFQPLTFLDYAAFNLYPYNPVTVKNILGYKRMLSYIKRDFSFRRPLVITEFGLSVSPQGEGYMGYGGNSLEDQKKGVLSMLDDIRTSNLSGYCVFQWNDGWFKNDDIPNDEISHESDPEEWFGILGITGSLKKPIEQLRPIYDALKYEQEFFLSYLDPVIVKGETLDIFFLAPRHPNQAKLQIETGERSHELEKGLYAFYGAITLPAPTEFPTTLSFNSIWTGENNQTLKRNSGSLTILDSQATLLKMDPLPRKIRTGEILTISGQGGILSEGYEILIGIHGHDGWNPGYDESVYTDPKGKFSLDYFVKESDIFLTISVSDQDSRWDVQQVEIIRTH